MGKGAASVLGLLSVDFGTFRFQLQFSSTFLDRVYPRIPTIYAFYCTRAQPNRTAKNENAFMKAENTQKRYRTTKAKSKQAASSPSATVQKHYQGIGVGKLMSMFDSLFQVLSGHQSYSLPRHE